MRRQDDLFNGYDLRAGRALKYAGIESVETNNMRFVDVMREIAKHISLRQGKVSCDDLREIADEAEFSPDHPNAWGSIFRGEHWQCIGRQQSAKKTNHAREIRVWQWRQGRS